jgi:signal transduction histidine kinase
MAGRSLGTETRPRSKTSSSGVVGGWQHVLPLGTVLNDHHASSSAAPTSTQGSPQRKRRSPDLGLIHDIRESVAAIGALSAVAMRGGRVSRETERQLRAICTEVDRLAALCDGRLNASEALDLSSLNLICRDVIRIRRPTLQTRIDYKAKSAVVCMGSTLASRIVVNLLSNACRAAGPQGVVRVAIEPQPGRRQVVLHVDDTGPGPSHGPRGALGIGLRVVEDLLRSHGGSFALVEGPLGGARATAVFLAPPSTHEGSPLRSELALT